MQAERRVEREREAEERRGGRGFVCGGVGGVEGDEAMAAIVKMEAG